MSMDPDPTVTDVVSDESVAEPPDIEDASEEDAEADHEPPVEPGG